MTDDNELERRQFMQKPTPAKPKVAGDPAVKAASLMFEKLVPSPSQQHDPFADFATIVKLLRRHSRATRLQILELVTELID